MRIAILGCLALLALGACRSKDAEPRPPDAPFVIEGIGFGEEFLHASDIDKDVARQVAERCPSGFEVGSIDTRRGTGRFTSQQIRYRALVRCKTAPSG